MIRRAFAVFGLVIAAGLSACGGGSSGATPTSAPTGGGTVTGGANPALTSSTAAVSLTVAPGDQALVQVVRLTVTPDTSGLYSSIGAGGTAVAGIDLVWDANAQNGARSADLEITLVAPPLIGSGTYHDTVTAHICLDAACTHDIAGSPVTVAVTYTVTGTAISDATYSVNPMSIDLESLSSGATQSVTLDITANELPPYGAYVSFKTRNGGAVDKIAFTQTGGKGGEYSWATGTGAVTLKAPAVLGPGSYSDLITLNICYDQACTKPASGSPFTIPVTYRVTASSGREFQQQIIDQAFTSLAVDPSGSPLFATTAPDPDGSGALAHLVQIDPATGGVTTLRSLPAAVSQIAISQDGAYLYLVTQDWSGVGLSPFIQVIRVRRSDASIDQTVPITSWETPLTHVAVSPIDSNVWSVGFPNQAQALEVQLFDGATARPNAWSVVTSEDFGNDAVWSADGSTLYVADTNLQSFQVSASGLGSGTVLQSGSAGGSGFAFGANLVLAGGLLYSGSGEVLDPSSNEIVGRFTFPSGLPNTQMTIDTANRRAFAAYIDSANNSAQGTIGSFDLSTFSALWVARLPIGTTPLRWGANGLAWLAPHTSPGQQALYLIQGSFVTPASTSTTSAH